METLKFLNMFFCLGGAVGPRTEHNWLWDEWYPYANLTELINFNCKFDKKGACIDRRKTGAFTYPDKINCCCTGCGYIVGFLHTLPNDIKILNNIAKLFNERNGFWKAGMGCTLPRKYRSLTCLTFRCNSIKPPVNLKGISKKKLEEILLIENILEMIKTSNESDMYRSILIENNKLVYGKDKKILSPAYLRRKLLEVKKK